MNLDRVIAVRNNKTVYRDGEHAIKLFDQDFRQADVLNEALNHARAVETSLCVPKLHQVGVLDGKWYIETEYIPGKTLSRLMSEFPEKQDAYLTLFVELQQKVHAARAPRLRSLKDKLNEKISTCSLEATVRYDLHSRLEDLPRGYSVCHGDFVPANIIIRDDGKAYILDWSHATQGNPASDVARTYLQFYLSGSDALAEKYLARFCEKSGMERQAIERWIPIVAAAQSVKGWPEERETLLRFVRADYEQISHRRDDK